MLCDVEVDEPPAVVREHDQDEEDAEPSSGHSEEIDRDQVTDMIGEKSSPSLRWRGASLGSKRETVRSATSMPSFASSPWIRGAPQSGFAAAMRVTRVLISALTGGRLAVEREESSVQYSRTRRRCHRRTVSGDTMTRACFQPAQTLASATHKRRSLARTWA
jgi:hypothetical protein